LLILGIGDFILRHSTFVIRHFSFVVFHSSFIRLPMPKTLSQTDPHLLTAVNRLARTQTLWGWLLISLGILTAIAARLEHPIAGMPFIAVGILCLRWGDPALLATVGTLIALSIVSTINPQATLLGPDPLTRLMALSAIEIGALVIGKILIVATAANQFFFYRLLYGTAQATADEMNLDIVPPMVENRTNGLARWARWLGLIGGFCAIAALLLAQLDPSVILVRSLAEAGGSLGAVAAGLGLGAAFSPTDERPAALLGVGVGLIAYFVAIWLLVGLG
jgi:hypothetical protein